MILDGILIQQGCAGAVAQNQAVGGCAVVIGSGEVLIVKPSRTAGGNDDGLCFRYQIIAGLHI